MTLMIIPVIVVCDDTASKHIDDTDDNDDDTGDSFDRC